MLTALFPQRFLLLTCLATVCKTMCGVAAGCTKSSITAHFAIQGNIAGTLSYTTVISPAQRASSGTDWASTQPHLYMHTDVAAKENAQETFVTLVGIVGGLLFAHSIADPAAAWPAFILLTLLHVFANYMGACVHVKWWWCRIPPLPIPCPSQTNHLVFHPLKTHQKKTGVSALRLYTLNTQRAALVVDDFLRKQSDAASGTSNTRAYDPVPVLTPHEAAEQERVWQPFLSWLRGDQPRMGARVCDLGWESSPVDLDFLLRRVYSHERYVLSAHPGTGRLLVLFREGAGARDELKAFFQV